MTIQPESIVKLKKSHIKKAAMMMARAFHDDPIVKYAFPKHKGADPRVRYAYEFMVRLGMRTGFGYTTSRDVEGVAIWARIKDPHTSFRDMLFSGSIIPAIRLGLKAGLRMMTFSEHMENKHQEVIRELHWYLQVLAVDPEHQGKGYAGRLLRKQLHLIDQEGLPCYLETEREVNVPLYEHFGFHIVEEHPIPDTPIVMWLMLRLPGG